MNAFTDLVTIAEMTPGPIAVNVATFVGMQIIGPLGAVGCNTWLYSSILCDSDFIGTSLY